MFFVEDWEGGSDKMIGMRDRIDDVPKREKCRVGFQEEIVKPEADLMEAWQMVAGFSDNYWDEEKPSLARAVEAMREGGEILPRVASRGLFDFIMLTESLFEGREGGELMWDMNGEDLEVARANCELMKVMLFEVVGWEGWL